MSIHQKHKGFTTAEFLLVIGILAVLAALTIPNIISMRRNLRQAELDAKAETVYVAVQNELSKLRAGGQTQLYQAAYSHGLTPGTPSDQEPERDEAGEPLLDGDGEERYRPIYYLVRGDEAADTVLREDVLEAGLLASAWVVEYDPELGSVYAVFYSEERSNLASLYVSEWVKYNGMLRSRDRRLEDGAKVGYYGGNFSASGAVTDTLIPTLSISNGEKLTAMMRCPAPVGAELSFKLTLDDGQGHTYTETYSNTLSESDPMHLERKGRSVYRQITLDDLSDEATRFVNLYGSGSSHAQKLNAGTELRLTLSVSSTDRTLQRGPNAVAVTNSLFADSSFYDAGDGLLQAELQYCRHLQNLDAASGLAQDTKARQLVDLSFQDDVSSEEDWYSVYANAAFQPIRNTHLARYDGENAEGKRCTVVGLRVSESGQAGLFAELSAGTVLNNITLIGPRVAGDTAGGLIGEVSGGAVTLHRCLLYLSASDRAIAAKENPDPWITGRTVGGLIGEISGGTVTVTESFAATVLTGEERAGGLVGRTGSGTLNLSASYADCYLSGAQTGGLVAGGTVAAMNDCYAAGFQTATARAAGLVNGTIAAAQRSYTISDMTGGSASTVYTTAETVSSGEKLYFFPHNGGYNSALSEAIQLTSKDLCAQLGDRFTTSTGDTVAYNLRGQSLRAYTYPRLAANRHYGDWKAEFQTGSLVYYEKYSDGTYGFFGAHVNSTLKETGTVVGDGYGIVYKADGDAVPTSISVEIDEGALATSANLNPALRYPVTGSDGTRYLVIPLPREIVNKDPVRAGFYRKAVITAVATGGGTSTDVYYFNPHFAQTAILSETPPQLYAGDTVVIRTPRHLYALSRYYDRFFAGETANCSFLQRRSISYSAYDWNGFYRQAPNPAIDLWTWSDGSGPYYIYGQDPIGADGGHAFRAVYDGGSFPISDISFVSRDGSYIGMFGYNRGQLQNIVLVTDYDIDRPEFHFFVKRETDITINQTVYMGILAGFNEGEIYNCATAGYYISGSDGTLHAYANSTLYVGGMAGGNAGTIQNSAADCPAIRLSSLDAVVDLGGFTGWNQDRGTVTDCYALGHIEVAYSQSGATRAAGFSGRNDGRIMNSYCAASLITSGVTARSFGFAPEGGLVQNSYYLDKGTYEYVGVLRSYGTGTGSTSGTPVTYNQLQSMQGSARPTAANSLHHPNTTESRYPYRAVVRDAGGAAVHYGDWQNLPVLGTLGVFYWEREIGGNDGYHITYIGTVEGSRDSGTNLCTAHDDGGEIREFGYGYYVQIGQEDQVSLSSDGIAYGAGNWNRTAARALSIQLTQYTFYPYTTGYGTSGDYLYLSDRSGKTTGTWTLTFHGPQGDKTYRYAIAPFFANSMQRLDSNQDILVTGSDYAVTNYRYMPGSAGNAFEVRSARQLQYINWNNNSYRADVLESQARAQQFPYLQYATRFGDNEQPQYVDEVYRVRPVRYWVQTHDLQGREFSDSAPFTPIAGASTSSSVNDWRAMIYGWFGGSYDGQSYQIRNLNVVSDSYTVGVFGITIGANIRNIIMNGDGTTRVERRTQGFNTGVGEGLGAYTLGGLIGTAFDYSDNSDNVISNCAIAGYQIIDNSTNQQGNGGANIGGLIGVASLNLEKCSAVTEIHVNCTHDNGTAQYGSFIRAGGLAGSANRRVTNCYTGGRIEVSQNTLDEVYIGRKKVSPDYSGQVKRDENTHVYIAGLTANTNRSRYTNFSSASVGTVTVSNCYTYVDLPDMTGTIRGVSLISGPGDRFSDKAAVVTVNNCYYLAGIENIRFQRPDYYFDRRVKEGGADPYAAYELTDADKQNILNGDLTINSYLINYDSTHDNRPLGDLPIAKTYEELHDPAMNGALGAAWSWVTVTEGSGARIDGKFSFSSDDAQAGKNYPFPTVITQKDTTYSTRDQAVWVNVHYGTWPPSQNYWENGRAEIDLFRDMAMDASGRPIGEGYAEKTFRLHFKQELTPEIQLSPASGVVELAGAPVREGESNWYRVTLRALGEGSVIVTETNTDASFILSVAHTLSLRSVPEATADNPLTLYQRSPESLTLYAAVPGKEAATESWFSQAGTWTLTETEPESETLIAAAQNAENPIPNEWSLEGYEPGQRSITAVYTYNYHGKDYAQTLYLSTRTLGYIGLTNGSAHSSALRQRQGAVNGTQAAGAPAGAPAGAELLLFGTAADGDLSRFVIRTIRVTPEGGSAQTVFADGAYRDGTDYQVSFPQRQEEDAVLLVCEKPTSGAAYQFCAGTVRYRGSGAVSPRITVTLVLEDPTTLQFDETSEKSYYTLSIPMNSVANHNIRFLSGGGTGRMFDVGVNSGDYPLPDCGFLRTGYSFAGWLVENSDTPQPAGTTVPVSGDLTLTAKWHAHTCTVHFDPNGGTGEMSDQVFTYDEEQPLTECGFTGPEEHPAFGGWNTEADGSGVFYADQAAILNLTDEDQPEPIVLYAQWKDRNHLTLMAAGSVYLQTRVDALNGKSHVVIPSGAALQVLGWTLEGWYSAADGTGVKVLDPDGEIAASARNLSGFTGGGTFELGGDRVLYACWEREAFGQTEALDRSAVSNGSGTYLIVSSSSTGSQKAAAETPFDEYAPVSFTTVRVVNAPVVTQDGAMANGYIETAPQKALWSAVYLKTEELAEGNRNPERPEQTSVDVYSFQNQRYEGFLENLNGTDLLSVTDNAESGTARWTYGQKYAHGLQRRNDALSTYQRMVYWNSGQNRWADASLSQPAEVWLYRWQTVHSFAPAPASPLYTVDFDPNGGTGSMADLLLSDGSCTLPECGFAKLSSRFIGWQLGDDPTLLQPGTAVPVSDHLTLRAQWQERSYTVRFDPNGGTGSDAAQTIVWDVRQNLRAIAELHFTGPAEAPNFSGWNTEADGSGIAYPDCASVLNLTENDSINLYAQWNDASATLTLMAGGSTVFHGVPSGDSVSYALPDRADGWTLEGWYTARSASGIKVLDSDGKVCANVSGYTADGSFELDGNRTLYARWSKQVYVPVDVLRYNGPSDSGNGQYLIVNSLSPGTQNAITSPEAVGSDKKANAANTTVTVLSGEILDEAGTERSCYIDGDNPNARAVWTVTYLRTTPLTGSALNPAKPELTSVDIYWVRSPIGLYLRFDSPLKVTTDRDWNGSPNNKHIWTYGQKFDHQLQCEHRATHADNNQTDTAVYFDGSKWTNTTGRQVWLFKLQTAHTFD